MVDQETRQMIEAVKALLNDAYPLTQNDPVKAQINVALGLIYKAGVGL